MQVYGLREARELIASERKALAAEFPRSSDPYIKGQRDALKALDAKIKAKIGSYMPVDDAPAILAD